MKNHINLQYKSRVKDFIAETLSKVKAENKLHAIAIYSEMGITQQTFVNFSKKNDMKVSELLEFCRITGANPADALGIGESELQKKLFMAYELLIKNNISTDNLTKQL